MFVDTNVLLYHWDALEPAKRSRATEWLDRVTADRSGRTSFQVLSEFYVNASLKLRAPIARGAAREFVETFFPWDPISIGPGLLDDAWRAQDRYQLSWWDALIVAAARKARCRTLLSEDFQAGQDFDGVRVVNPFETAPNAGA